MNKKITLCSISFFLILSSLLFIFTREEVKTIVKYPLIDSVDRALIFIGLKEDIKIPAEYFPHGMPDPLRYNTSRRKGTTGIVRGSIYMPYSSINSHSLSFDTNFGDDIFIYHDTDYKISNCDMSEWTGEKEPERLRDLSWDIRHYNGSIEDVLNLITIGDDHSYLYDTVIDGRLTENQELGVKKITIGRYEGFEIYTGAEGCGGYTYYLNTGKGTMFVVRTLTQAFNPIRPDYLDNLALPEIITPGEEEALFYKVISSIEIIEE